MPLNKWCEEIVDQVEKHSSPYYLRELNHLSGDRPVTIGFVLNSPGLVISILHILTMTVKSGHPMTSPLKERPSSFPLVITIAIPLLMKIHIIP